jgi:hypothetical protein
MFKDLFKTVLALICTTSISGITLAKGPPVEWHKGYGTDSEEHVHEGFQTSDGGYLGIGQTFEPRSSFTDILIVKLDANGDQDWQQIIGSTGAHDVGIAGDEVKDGYIVGGGLHVETQQRSLVKLDFDGNIVWQKSYLHAGHGAIRGIVIDDDGGIVTTGYVDSDQPGYLFIADEADGFIMKSNQDGDLLWDRGISATQGAKVLKDPNSGGFAIATTVWVFDEHDHQDVRLIVTDGNGVELWSNDYGGSEDDQCFDLDATSDGGYVCAGHTKSFGVANWDYYLLKIGQDGSEEWYRTFGQPRGYDPRYIHDEAYGVRQTPDGGYIVAGGSGDEYSYSESGHSAGPSDEWKAYLVKTDAQGNPQWEAVYGEAGAGHNAAEYVGLTVDGDLIVFTDTDSQMPPQPNNFGFMKLDQSIRCAVKLDSTVGGDSFNFQTSFIRYRPDDSPVDYWAEVHGPSGYHDLSFVRKRSVPLAKRVGRTNGYTILGDESGDYVLSLYVGTYPDRVECESAAVYQLNSARD